MLPGAGVDGVVLPFLAAANVEHDGSEDEHDAAPGEGEVDAEGACDRCLENVVVPLRVDVEERFDPPGGFDLKAYWESSTRRFERSMSRETAIVRSTRAALPLLERIATGPVRQNKDGDPNVVTLPIESIERAVRDLLALGDAVEVLSPVELRNRIAAAAGATARLYATS